jgi:NAD(P)-dependent dehydrogenase (short-subunit alcohol dehydrogenase family)
MRRGGRTSDVSALVAWLCTDEAFFVTGQVIAVDGGLFAAAPWPRREDGTYKPG